MPTPFYHLSLGEDILHQPLLPDEIQRFLLASRGAFLFGNTAPDVQVVSGQTRQETHFFNLPIYPGDIPAHEFILRQYPQLSTAGRRSSLQAAFIAGYLCHLQADWLWVKEIFAPVFGPEGTWSTFHKRLYLHNVLRAYLDRLILPGLPADLDGCLRQVETDGWLPFVEDVQLDRWRDFLYPQLHPGGDIQTVKVLSARQGVSTPEFQALLGSEERMQEEVFKHVSLGQVQDYRQQVIGENIQLLSGYLAYLLHDMISPVRRNQYPGVQPLN